MKRIRISYLGNFQPAHSTETHVAASLEALGHEVNRLQEGSMAAVTAANTTIRMNSDLFLWTQTLSLAEQMGHNRDRVDMLQKLRSFSVPSAGFHLDRWWGLSREGRVRSEAFFKCDYVFTADGGHQQEWADSDINHHWLPPGVFHGEAHDGLTKEPYLYRVAFVGSWQGYGHREWHPHRQRMIEALQHTFKHEFHCFPDPGQPRIVYPELNDLYASADVIIGDSCLAPTRRGEPIPRYWSDRVPETMGRGGFLIHPHVDGIEEVHPYLSTFPLKDFDAMLERIHYFLGDPDARERVREVNARHTRENGTYRDRMRSMLSTIFPES